MTRVAVRSDALLAVGALTQELAEEVREEAARLAAAVPRVTPGVEHFWAMGNPRKLVGPAGPLQWERLRVQAAVIRLVGPEGAWGEALALDALAVHVRAAARVYAEAEQSVAAVVEGVRAVADLAARGGWLTDGLGAVPVVAPVSPTVAVADLPGTSAGERVTGAAGLVAAGEGLEGGRVRVLETTRGDGGAAWVVVVPGTQQWSARPGPNPFDVTTNVRAMTGDATLAAAGVAVALDAARAASGRSTADDPVALVGHSQGGILAAALASDTSFTARHRITHVLTSGAPVALFAVPAGVRVLSVEHTDDPVPRLDLTPNPSSSTWVTVRVAHGAAALDPRSHGRETYVRTLHAAESAPHGTVEGLDAWRTSAGDFLGVPVRSVWEYEVRRR